MKYLLAVDVVFKLGSGAGSPQIPEDVASCDQFMVLCNPSDSIGTLLNNLRDTYRRIFGRVVNGTSRVLTRNMYALDPIYSVKDIFEHKDTLVWVLYETPKRDHSSTEASPNGQLDSRSTAQSHPQTAIPEPKISSTQTQSATTQLQTTKGQPRTQSAEPARPSNELSVEPNSELDYTQPDNSGNDVIPGSCTLPKLEDVLSIPMQRRGYNFPLLYLLAEQSMPAEDLIQEFVSSAYDMAGLGWMARTDEVKEVRAQFIEQWPLVKGTVKTLHQWAKQLATQTVYTTIASHFKDGIYEGNSMAHNEAQSMSTQPASAPTPDTVSTQVPKHANTIRSIKPDSAPLAAGAVNTSRTAKTISGTPAKATVPKVSATPSKVTAQSVSATPAKSSAKVSAKSVSATPAKVPATPAKVSATPAKVSAKSELRAPAKPAKVIPATPAKSAVQSVSDTPEQATRNDPTVSTVPTRATSNTTRVTTNTAGVISTKGTTISNTKTRATSTANNDIEAPVEATSQTLGAPTSVSGESSSSKRYSEEMSEENSGSGSASNSALKAHPTPATPKAVIEPAITSTPAPKSAAPPPKRRRLGVAVDVEGDMTVAQIPDASVHFNGVPDDSSESEEEPVVRRRAVAPPRSATPEFINSPAQSTRARANLTHDKLLESPATPKSTPKAAIQATTSATTPVTPAPKPTPKPTPKSGLRTLDSLGQLNTDVHEGRKSAPTAAEVESESQNDDSSDSSSDDSSEDDSSSDSDKDELPQRKIAGRRQTQKRGRSRLSGLISDSSKLR